MTVLTIDRLGGHGDGIADVERGPVYVPFALPGEVIDAAVEKDRGTLLSIVEPVVTVTAAALVFGESLSVQQALGGLMVLGAVGIVQWPVRAGRRRALQVPEVVEQCAVDA